MSDYIKREDAITYAGTRTHGVSLRQLNDIMNDVVMTLQNVPSADVEPVRHGHWIAVTVSSGRDSWQCSECGRHARGKIENLPYCHCGARMDGGNDE